LKHISFGQKILVCIIAALVSSLAILRISFRMAWEFLDRWSPTPPFVIIPAGLFLITAVSCCIYWQKKETSQQWDGAPVLAFWQAVTRYFIAIDLSMIGWQKIFHVQFSTPLGILDEPFSSFSGEGLTWAYFGHSYGFVCAVGVFQIAGSYLLLFKRTQLLGEIVLIPVLLNIVLIDFFYGLAAGELLHAVILMLGLLYLLLFEYKRLVQFFFIAKSSFPAMRLKTRGLKNLVRLSAGCIPLALMIAFGPPDKNPQLTGKYEVKELIVNQKTIAVNSCQDSVLTIVYFDQGNDIVFEYNHQKRRLIGSYHFDKTSRKMKAVWRYPQNKKDTLMGTLSSTGIKDQMMFAGTMGKDSLQAVLIKVK
jgi:hypothetical protein